MQDFNFMEFILSLGVNKTMYIVGGIIIIAILIVIASVIKETRK